jgi:hypothetical protein
VAIPRWIFELCTFVARHDTFDHDRPRDPGVGSKDDALTERP